MTDVKKLRELAQIAIENGTMFLIDTQAIIELLDMVDRYREALEHYESAHYTISGFPCDHDGVAREALEGGK